MNFFGHAVVASELFSDPYVVLGAMLPDLEEMVGSRASRFADLRVVKGVALHHVTDAVFHGAAEFIAQQNAALSLLAPLPVRKGPRRAVAHVGVELILDAALRTPQRLDAYVHALTSGREVSALRGVPLVQRLKFRSLFGALIRRAPFVTPTGPSGVVERLEKALWARPSLRLQPTELPYVLTWAEAAWQPIHDASRGWFPRLVQTIDVRLGSNAASGIAPAK